MGWDGTRECWEQSGMEPRQDAVRVGLVWEGPRVGWGRGEGAILPWLWDAGGSTSCLDGGCVPGCTS